MASEDVTARPVGGRYELHQLLGQGGMGSVWRAQDLLLQRPVAVKRVELPLHLPATERDALRQRVLREARAAARVSHPRLVTIFDVVEEEGTVFLVQELVDAPTLKSLVTDDGPMAPAEVARIGRQLVEGLAAAHHNGVIHRDVKPSNVMVRSDGSVKLTDFGIASVHGDPQLTATGLVIGSPAYMAPEQATGGKITSASDLWSLGATLYFALEGVAPFGRADTISTLTAVVNDPHRPMELAGPMASVIERLLVKSPDARADGPEATRLLDRLDGRPAPVPDRDRTVSHPEPTQLARAESTTVQPQVRTSTPSPTPIARTSERRPLGALTALVVVLLVGGLALAAFLGSQGNGDGDRVAATNPSPASTSTTEKPTTTAAPKAAAPTTTPPAAAPAAAAGVPADWKQYRDAKTGYTVAHPPSWTVRSRDESRTDFVDPATNSYLRVDWTDEPGPSAQQAWVDQSKSFAKKQQNYREIRIEPTRFAGSDNASLWEYSYTSGGSALHAYNLGFVLGDDYGFALNFQTAESRFAESQGLFEQLKAGFAPPQDD